MFQKMKSHWQLRPFCTHPNFSKAFERKETLKWHSVISAPRRGFLPHLPHLPHSCEIPGAQKNSSPISLSLSPISPTLSPGVIWKQLSRKFRPENGLSPWRISRLCSGVCSGFIVASREVFLGNEKVSCIQYTALLSLPCAEWVDRRCMSMTAV